MRWRDFEESLRVSAREMLTEAAKPELTQNPDKRAAVIAASLVFAGIADAV